MADDSVSVPFRQCSSEPGNVIAEGSDEEFGSEYEVDEEGNKYKPIQVMREKAKDSRSEQWLGRRR